MRKYFILLAVAYLFVNNAPAQEMWGISNSNFSGHMGLYLNPSTIVGAPYQYEINLASMDLFAENTNIYVFESDKMIFHSLTGYARDGKNFFTRNPRLNNSFGHGLLIGPSYLRNKTTSAWGIHSALRTEVSTLNMSPELALFLKDKFLSQILYGDTITAPAFKNAYASWIELGGTYGKVLRESEYHIIKWAANGNLLIGMNGFTTHSKNLSFTSVDSSQVLVNGMDNTLAHSINNEGGSIFGLRGIGLSTTVGLTYINHPNRGAFDCNMSNDRQKKYKYRLGFSLLDLGTIYYFNNAQKTVLNTTSPKQWTGVDTFAFSSFESIDTNFVKIIGGETKKKNFNIWLPLGASMQFDYQIRANLFANLSWVNRIHFAANEIARINQLNASIRYERRRYEANLNFSFAEYKRPSMGVGLRYRFFVIGSDRLLQTLGLAEEKVSTSSLELNFSSANVLSVRDRIVRRIWDSKPFLLLIFYIFTLSLQIIYSTMKNILSVIAGLITAFIIFMLFEAISSAMFPPPAALNTKNPEALKEYISSLPAYVMLIVLAGYVVGSFLGGFIVGKVSGSPLKKLPLLFGSILTVASIVNLILIPSPFWFVVINVVCYIPLALLGHSMSISKKAV